VLRLSRDPHAQVVRLVGDRLGAASGVRQVEASGCLKGISAWLLCGAEGRVGES
jgi:hypothetical protein